MNAEPIPVSHEGTAVETLREQRGAWEERPLLRRLYGGWFEQMEQRMSRVPGESIEIGAGCGALRDHLPEIVTTDVVATPWADRVADAEELPFDDRSAANLLMVDVLHHVPRPDAALREAERVLAPGGRLIMLEPYCSPLSTLAYRRFHHEPADLDARLDAAAEQSSDDPFDSNQAIPTILFWRRPELVSQWAPGLSVVERRRLAWLVYPLSGGFTRPPLLPARLAGAALALEGALASVMSPLAAFRCLVVLERR